MFGLIILLFNGTNICKKIKIILKIVLYILDNLLKKAI